MMPSNNQRPNGYASSVHFIGWLEPDINQGFLHVFGRGQPSMQQQLASHCSHCSIHQGTFLSERGDGFVPQRYFLLTTGGLETALIINYRLLY